MCRWLVFVRRFVASWASAPRWEGVARARDCTRTLVDQHETPQMHYMFPVTGTRWAGEELELIYERLRLWSQPPPDIVRLQ